MKRIVITSDRLNCYGTWIVTAGVDLEQYTKNPVLLYMHERGKIIGYLKDIKVEGEIITAEPYFDESSELSRTCKDQYEKGSLRMASISLRIMETSEDPAMLKEGQTSPTVTRSKLIEVSMVDVGGNDDAIRLFDGDSKEISLGEGGDNPLPKIQINKPQRMETKDLALMLGLPETATEEEVRAKIMELQAASQEVAQLRAERDSLNLSTITGLVESAISERKLGADKKQQFVELGQKVGIESLKATLSAMNPAAKASDFINQGGSVEAGKYTKLSEVPSDKIMELRNENPEQYKALFRAEYGIDCNL